MGDATQLWQAAYVDNFLASINAVGDPSYSFHADPDTGMYSTGANTIDFATGGTLALTVDSSQGVTCAANLSIPASTTGNVRGGTYSPTVSNATAGLGSATVRTHSYIRVANTTIVYGYLTFASNSDNSPSFQITLPISPGGNFSSVYDLLGHASNDDAAGDAVGGRVLAVSGAERASIAWTSDTNPPPATISYSFAYQIS